MNRKKILLVEDNLSDIALTKLAIDKSRIANELVVIENGQDALDYLFGRGKYANQDLHQLPALVLLDINLPVVNGLEVLRKIRGNEVTKRLPVVMLTTSKEEQDIAQSYNLGANSYIQKPVDFFQFVESVKRLGMYWLVTNQVLPK
jgi:two-component system, response regulator